MTTTRAMRRMTDPPGDHPTNPAAPPGAAPPRDPPTGPPTGPSADLSAGAEPRTRTGAVRPTSTVPAGTGVLRAAAVIATVPYLVLKGAWLAGSRIGIPDGSVLLEPGPLPAVANAVTMAMDACVIVLALLLTRPWGRRVPGPLLIVPVYTATGLLTPILTGFPGQLVVRALGLGAGDVVKAARGPFLDDWVYTVVYGGFIVQGLALAGLFVPYARERWGRCWQGPPGRRLPSPTGVVAGAAATVGAAVGAIPLYWAVGGAAWLSARQVAQYSAESGVISAVHGLCALAAGAGALLLARGGGVRVRWPLALAWIGSSASLGWGLWLLTAVLGLEFADSERLSPMIYLAYAGQVIVGGLCAAVLARFTRSRLAA
ncbi:hypothetical protein [Streptomyces sp. NPDC047718]|uniref:hypothetical protein n=1 Tax=Streptomyces sp. NPDC047718 TaxID=3155479 RepID=UPI0033D50FB8